MFKKVEGQTELFIQLITGYLEKNWVAAQKCGQYIVYIHCCVNKKPKPKRQIQYKYNGPTRKYL